MSTSVTPVRRVTRASVRAATNSIKPNVESTSLITPKESAEKRLERFKKAAQKTPIETTTPTKVIRKPLVEPKLTSRRPLASKTSEINRQKPVVSSVTTTKGITRKLSAPTISYQKPSPKTTTNTKLSVIREENLEKEKKKYNVLRLSYDAMTVLLKWFSDRDQEHKEQISEKSKAIQKISQVSSKFSDIFSENSSVKQGLINISTKIHNDFSDVSKNIENLNAVYKEKLLRLKQEFDDERASHLGEISALKESHMKEVDDLSKKISDIESLNERSESTSSGIEPDVDSRRARITMRRNRSCVSRRNETTSLSCPLDTSDENCSIMTSSFYADNEISSLKAVLEMKNTEIAEFRKRFMETEDIILDLQSQIKSLTKMELSFEELKYKYHVSLEEIEKLKTQLSDRDRIILQLEQT